MAVFPEIDSLRRDMDNMFGSLTGSIFPASR